MLSFILASLPTREFCRSSRLPLAKRPLLPAKFSMLVKDSQKNGKYGERENPANETRRNMELSWRYQKVTIIQPTQLHSFACIAPYHNTNTQVLFSLHVCFSKRKNEKPKKCSGCSGIGTVDCTFCNGTGVMTLGDQLLCSTSGNCSCVVCKTTGQIPCDTCHGTGYIASWLEETTS